MRRRRRKEEEGGGARMEFVPSVACLCEDGERSGR
jgi:hypothetical protein